MRKQGPPEPLSEEHFAKLKRKAGLPVDDVPAESPKNKKRKTAEKVGAKKTNGAAAAGKKGPKSNGQLNTATKPKAAPAKAVNGRKKPKKAPEPEEDDDISDGLGEGLDDSDLDDEFDLEGADAHGLKDDFLESDDSVYDSDEGGAKAMFSEDEGDSDAEEQLTAANIAGLSAKLDAKMAQEEAEAQAELEDAAMQTNIDGDRPHILEDEDEDAGLAAKTKALLAPDLQLLRTRITDTIRVLGDFAKLAEEGRSRAEYTAQLLKDICAYYGYSEYLAEKLYSLFTPQVCAAQIAVFNF